MPTRKEVSKIKQDYVDQRKKAISDKIILLEQKLYDRVIPDFLSMATKKDKPPTITDLNNLQRIVKQNMAADFPGVMKETARSAKGLGDLNQMYFSTLVDSNRLEEINAKTNKIVDRKLGLDSNGQLIKGGFTDKAIRSDKVQLKFVREVKNAVAGGKDPQALKESLKKIIQGSPTQNGIVSQYYNTFAKDILNTIDRSNGNIYANELDLNHFYFSGGLIKTSRPFCLKCNGKIFSRDQADKWKDKLGNTDGPVWDESRDGEYVPVENMGGLGCLHTPDWITQELAIGRTRDQNRKAAERNQNFADKHGL